MLSKYQKQLEEFGLSGKEAIVYTALLTSGATTASELANITELNRSTTYVQLKSLMASGLVSSYKENKKTCFSAESPDNLQPLLDKKITDLQEQREKIGSLLPELVQAFSKHSVKPVIRHFQGKDGLAAMRNEVFASQDNKIRLVTDYDDLRRVFTKPELREYSRRRKEQTIDSYVLYTTAEETDFKPFHYQYLQRVSTESRPFACDVYIYGNTVSFAAMKQEVVGVSIDQVDIARTMKTLFDCYWDTLRSERGHT